MTASTSRTSVERCAASPPSPRPNAGEVAGRRPPLLVEGVDYAWDAAQRVVLFLDVLRQRGDNALRLERAGNPPVLDFAYEVLIDGRDLPHPVNYSLLRIKPRDGVRADKRRRPFVIVDPRAGHGPGIGGFKQASEVGMALNAGHPVYFVSFRPRPVPGQTLVDVGRAEAIFLETVARLHPEADKPCVIGNCQAGWAVAALAAIRPELMGPLILSGAPMAYWSGVSGQNPMRYAGGLLGGQWLESLACDIGHGLFDGAWLVANFENLNPANTLWTKYYNLYSKVDTEPERFLDFEAWWSGYFLMNAEEIGTIVRDLFIGNQLARTVDLRQIRTPVVVFTSRGDNIAPPQQTLNWIVDVYGNERALIDAGRVIIYLLHESIGHLGIFVSGQVATKEYAGIVGTLDMIDALPPGLYQMIIEPVGTADARVSAAGPFAARFEVRTFDDISALDDGRADEAEFRVVDEVSRIGDAWYRAWVSPLVQFWATDRSAELVRQWHPLRLQRRLLSGENPFLAATAALAPWIRAARRPAGDDNVWRAQEARFSRAIVAALDLGRDLRDAAAEATFKLAYGPCGWGAFLRPSRRTRASARPALPPAELADADELNQGGLLAAIVRMLAAACLDAGVFDQRSARALHSFFAHSAFSGVTVTELKALFRKQAALLRRFPDRAVDVLADMLLDEGSRQDAVRTVDAALAAASDAPRPDGPLSRRIRQALGSRNSGETLARTR
jgi:hypothetical protein